jgi:hypothetical protein
MESQPESMATDRVVWEAAVIRPYATKMLILIFEILAELGVR